MAGYDCRRGQFAATARIAEGRGSEPKGRREGKVGHGDVRPLAREPTSVLAETPVAEPGEFFRFVTSVGPSQEVRGMGGHLVDGVPRRREMGQQEPEHGDVGVVAA
jgi:hypothetical protein